MNRSPDAEKNLAITIRSFSPEESLCEQLERKFVISYRNISGNRLGEEEVIAAVHEADAVIAGTEPFSRRVFDAAPRLKIISRIGVGLDTIDLEAASARGIRILTTPVSTVQPVAEHTLALILCAMKKITVYNEAMRSGQYGTRNTFMLEGKTVGVVGLGRIGYRVAEILSCLGCHIIFFDPYTTIVPPRSWKQSSNLRELLNASDIITLHLPAQKGNIPVLDREAFNQCRQGVLVINTARGSLIDEHALSEALNSGRVEVAGLDVFAREPYNGPLLSNPRVVMTPHIASNTLESRRAMEREAVENLITAVMEKN